MKYSWLLSVSLLIDGRGRMCPFFFSVKGTKLGLVLVWVPKSSLSWSQSPPSVYFSLVPYRERLKLFKR